MKPAHTISLARKKSMCRLNVFLCWAVVATAFFTLPLLTDGATTSNGVMLLEGRGGSLGYPLGWTPYHYANLHELWNITPEGLSTLQPVDRESVPRIEINVISCASHDQALRRLREIEAEWGKTSRFLIIGGWPALQRRQLVPAPREGDDEEAGPENLYMVTTAVAAGETVVRMDGFAPETASALVLDQMESIGRFLRPVILGDSYTAGKEVEQLRRSPLLRTPEEAMPPMAAEEKSDAMAPVTPMNLEAGAGVTNAFLGSETEIAVSPNGTYIVVAQQCNYVNSNNGGASFLNGGSYPGFCTGGDSSVALGVSGNFYWSTIGSNGNCPKTKPRCNNIQEVAVSTTNGATFLNGVTVIDCLVTPGCGFGGVPDQEHIAADRVTPSALGDQVYLVFRRGFGYGISCSTNSGSTWSPVVFRTGGTIDFPRITVGRDGSVYVIYVNGNLSMDHYNSCSKGLVLGTANLVKSGGGSPTLCPIPGIDRCNNGNILIGSPMVAVDDTSPNDNHLYVTFGANKIQPAPVPPNPTSPPLTTLGSDNVFVTSSTDDGATWSPNVRLNSNINGRRYEAWVCSTNGIAIATWQDRRAATLTSNDLTDYFGGIAFLNSLGTLTAGPEFKIDEVADPQCASGWPAAPRSANDSESCSTQPQLAGRCKHTPPNPLDSKTPCDFSGPDATACPSGETCQIGGGGPKYGDYTGNACVLGRLLAAWPSATNQPGAAPTGGNITSFFALTVVASTTTTTTYTGPNSGSGTVTLSATLVLSGTTIPIPGQPIKFTLGTQNCSGATDATGSASCSITLTQPPGSYTVKATFAGGGKFQASNNAAAFTIT